MGRLLRQRIHKQRAKRSDLKSLQKWLHARGAMWSPKVTYSTRCIAGFGLIATKPLTKGEVLFVAP